MQTEAKLVLINQLGVTEIMQHATDASEIAVPIAFWHNFPHPSRYPVVQIEPTSYQAVYCGQFCLQIASNGNQGKQIMP